ncbi:type IV toxin-antitoxin system AbiEi family antitoxin domain-containing protein [Desulfosarcina ovata]|uniref:type IV toxin-antitoxin system AbiEi family antitoxin domain-containing protein n=1 Tax=Desulfosarcina ovata TaxID=83564 RepID=UPI0012D34DA6|nr:transcriptional regulator [Desulfosarcina ovata]
MKHDAFFRKHPVFTGKELAGHLSSLGEVRGRTQESLLAYHRKAGRVVLVRRGLYAVIPPGADPGSYPIDPFLVAAKLTPDAVLSHYTALEFHGKAYSVHTHFVYSASRPLGSLNFRAYVFRGARFPQALLRFGKENFGVSAAERSGQELRVTTLERTLVDVLDRPDLSGSWEEIWRSLESVEFFDLDKVVEYALLLGNATTGAKVGFFLDQHRETLMVDDRHLNMLHDMRPRQPHYLNRSKRKSGRLVSEWNLVVPSIVLERAWGEVP